MGRLEAETGGEVSAGSSIAAAFARDPFRNPPPCLTRPDLACLDDCEHGRAGPCARSLPMSEGKIETTGLWATLTPEQRAQALTQDCVGFGPADGPRVQQQAVERKK